MSLTTVKQASDLITVVKNVGDRIKDLRGDEGQAAFARRVGLSAGTIGNIEAGTRQGSAETLQKIAAACGVRLEWLVSGRPPKHEVTGAAALQPVAPSPPPARTDDLENALARVLDAVAALPAVRWPAVQAMLAQAVGHPEMRAELVAELAPLLKPADRKQQAAA